MNNYSIQKCRFVKSSVMLAVAQKKAYKESVGWFWYFTTILKVDLHLWMEIHDKRCLCALLKSGEHNFKANWGLASQSLTTQLAYPHFNICSDRFFLSFFCLFHLRGWFVSSQSWSVSRKLCYKLLSII